MRTWKKLQIPQQQDIGNGTAVTATHQTKDERGMVARCELWNKQLLDTTVLHLDDEQERNSYGARMAASHPSEVPDAQQMITAVLHLSSVLSAEEQGESETESQASRLVRLACEEGAELWRTDDNRAFATISVDNHREHRNIRSKALRQWLSLRFHAETGRVPGSQALQDALIVLEGRAAFEGSEYAVSVRLAEQGGTIYLDLCNTDWQAVAIDAQGWRIVDDPPVRFQRSSSAQALPNPVPGGDVEELRQFVNVATDDDWRLLLSWLVAALRPVGPYPALALYGEQGSAKSSTARLLAALVDPRVALLRSEPHGQRDLMIAATNGWLVAFDNLSKIPDWLSDALCRLATGGGFSTRELYTNDEEAIFDAQRPVIFTAIEEVAVRGDLLDRCLPLTLAPIPEGCRRPESELWRSFEEARPRILGALLDAVSAALANLPRTRLDRLPRMADFAVWSCAAAPALGWSQRAFLDAYAMNRETAHASALDAVSWLPHLDTLGCPWQGTATELLGKINEQAGETAVRQKGWPSNGRALAGALRRLAPHLRARGLNVLFTREGHGKRRIIHLENAAAPSSAPSAPSAASITRPPTEGTIPDDADATDGADAKIAVSLSCDPPLRGPTARVSVDSALYPRLIAEGVPQPEAVARAQIGVARIASSDNSGGGGRQNADMDSDEDEWGEV